MIPMLGIFALEVKGGRVKRTDGIWSFTDKYGHSDKRSKGPFDQAWDGMYSIRQSLSDKLDVAHKHLEKIFFGIGVSTGHCHTRLSSLFGVSLCPASSFGDF